MEVVFKKIFFVSTELLKMEDFCMSAHKMSTKWLSALTLKIVKLINF